MALYKRHRSKERPMSLYTGSTSPVLLSYSTFTSPSMSPVSSEYMRSMSTALADISNITVSDQNESGGLDTTLTSCDQSECFEQYDLEIAELSHSPTCSAGKKVWNFSTPENSPSSSRRSGDTSGSPSPDVTPIAPHVELINDSVPPSPASTVSSSLQQFASRLRGGNRSSINLDNSGNEKRYMVINEIIDTERRYINSLETLLNVYLPALEHFVAPRDLRLLFPCQLEPLMDRHNILLTKLEERMGDNTLFPGIVGDVFARLLKESNTDFLNMYSAYMNEFKVAMTTLSGYEQQSTEFRDLLLMYQHSPSCEGLSLASYLLTPIQRLPRYELLLKELLRQTPLDHPDNFYVSDAIDLIHQELIRLNQSIKSCQMACSVRRVPARKTSFRVRTEKAIAKIRRHVSTANIDDYSSGDSSTGQEVRRSRTVRRRRATLKPSPYRSEENLFAVMDDERSRPTRVKSMMNIRPVSSLSNLAISFDGEDIKRKPHLLTPLASLPTTPEPSVRPTSPSESSINPITSEESSRTRSRLSLYSIASSTSGIGSIENSQFDLRLGSLTPTKMSTDLTCTSTPVTTRVSFNMDFQASEKPASVSGASVMSEGHTKDARSLKRKMSWASAFKLLSRKKSYSASRVLDIGSPKNFRHIQHGFPTLPEGVEANTPPCTSNTSSNNTLNAVNL